MNRKECYAQIKKMGLEEIIKQSCGRNYTQVTTAVLESIITSNSTAKNTLTSDNISNKNSTCTKCKKVDYKEKYWKTIKALAHCINLLPKDTLDDIENVESTTIEHIVESIDFSEEDIKNMF